MVRSYLSHLCSQGFITALSYGHLRFWSGNDQICKVIWAFTSRTSVDTFSLDIGNIRLLPLVLRQQQQNTYTSNNLFLFHCGSYLLWKYCCSTVPDISFTMANFYRALLSLFYHCLFHVSLLYTGWSFSWKCLSILVI